MINPLVAIIIASFVLITQSFAEEAPDLHDARQRYEAGPQTESARSFYLTELVRMRERIARNKDETWKAVDAEIRHRLIPLFCRKE